MKKILFIILSIVFATNAIANQPKEWQLGFQNAASEGMRDIVNFHNNLLLPIIIAISVFVLFLMIYFVLEDIPPLISSKPRIDRIAYHLQLHALAKRI